MDRNERLYGVDDATLPQILRDRKLRSMTERDLAAHLSSVLTKVQLIASACEGMTRVQGVRADVASEMGEVGRMLREACR